MRVTVIEPGLVGGTEFSNVRFHGDDARAAQVYAGADAAHGRGRRRDGVLGGDAARRVNINLVEMMPVGQSFAGYTISRSR